MKRCWRFPPTWMKRAQPKHKAILFFDGSCAFCSALVRFVIVRDRDDLLTFAPLQGETIKEKHIHIADLDTVILYIENGEILYKSDAIIALLERLGGLWFIIAKVSQCIPKILRDFVYDFIAKIRYKIAGEIDHSSCPILPKNYQSKILL